MSIRIFFATVAIVALLNPVVQAANKTPPAADAQAGQNIDAVAEAIFKQADRNGDKKMSQAEFRAAVTMIEQYAMTLPVKTTKNNKPINPNAAALGAPAAATPDFSNGKHLTPDEFKAAFPGLLFQAETTLAQLRAQAAAAGKAPKKGN